MGQCYGKVIKRRQWLRSRQFRHKRFDFTPKRLWRYRDAHMLNEFPDMGGQADGEVDDVIIENEMVEDSEEEIDTGEVRQSGRLVFSDEEEEEGLGEGGGRPEAIVNDTHLQVRVARERTVSSGSEQIGRFEVMDIETPPASASKTESAESSSSESSSEGGSVEGVEGVEEVQEISEKDIAYLIENEAVT